MSYIIEDYMIKDLNLSGNELLTYAFLTTQGVCDDTLEQMRSKIGMKSVTTLKTTLKSLLDRGLITSTKEKVNYPTTYSVVNTPNTTKGVEEVSNKINPREILRRGVMSRRSVLD